MAPLGNGTICHATPARNRALLALVAPFLAWGYAIAMLWIRGYSIFDYPHLIQAGQLGLFRQGVGWVCTAYWIARYWPSAIEALRNPCLIWEERRTLRLATGASVIKEEIEAIEIRHGIISKAIEVRRRNGHALRQSIMLTQERKLDILNALRQFRGHDTEFG